MDMTNGYDIICSLAWPAQAPGHPRPVPGLPVAEGLDCNARAP